MKPRSILSFRTLILAVVLLCSFSVRSLASHIVGADLYYTSLGGLQYRVTVVLYGDCGPLSATAFASLPTARPQVCIYDGAAFWQSYDLRVKAPSAGVEITPVCPDSLARTQCTNTSYDIPGIKKFVYDTVITLPNTSTNWRFVFNGGLGTAGSAGRAAAITNITGGSTMQLEATLNNSVYTNSSPSLTVVPTPFFCLNRPTCYTPGAIDPESDSMRFDLVNAMNGTANCTAAGTPCSYTGTAWGTTPITATTPLRVTAGSYSFSNVNGQLCFDPNFTQRAVVVYNVSEYRDGTLVGTCQREMTFIVRGCHAYPPTVDVPTIGGVIVADNATEYHVCGNLGTFSLTMNPRPDVSIAPPLNLTCTATGLPSGITFSVINNGTPAPTVTFNGNASAMTPGTYTFFLVLKDDACALNGTTTTAYTVVIYPVPAIIATITSPIECLQPAGITATPGGQGSPWVIKVLDSSLTAPSDTVASYTTSTPVLDWRNPGTYYYVIYTNITTECSLSDTVRVVAPPRLTPTADSSNPTYCGANDGALILSDLNIGGIDTVTYDKNGTAEPPFIGVVNGSGKLVVPNLRSGVYSNIVVHYGYCTSLPIGPVTLSDPPFTLRAVTYTDPTKCGFCNGSITLLGLHPDQLDTVTYNYNGSPQSAISYYITGDSSVILPGMCAGAYTTFTVKTAGTCTKTLTTVASLVAPPIGASFDTAIHYGCKGDTLIITNTSFPASDLTYSWNFGDGGSSTEINPVHVYTNTVSSSYVVRLYVTNTKCIDSDSVVVNLNHFVKADFTQMPDKFVCQIDPVTFTNASTGTGVDYTWYFGDGTSENTTDPVHIYTNMGTYYTTLVAHNITGHINCYDTLKRPIEVDSNSQLSMILSGGTTSLCRGQAVTLTAIYTNSGQVSNAWTSSDGFAKNNLNPLMHSFDGTGAFILNFDAKFRACPEKDTTINFYVYDVPAIYLGPDTAICEGSNPIILKDHINEFNGHARWHWNTDAVGSGITVTKPGVYAATVTIDGCTATDSVIVGKDCYVDVPNVFTPNGDGLNDYFFPRKFLSKSLTSFKMDIYNRWGQLIYETEVLDGRGWDGAFNGTPQPAGVYVYIIQATFADGNSEQHQGNVTLLR